jgi:cell division septation protein DedD
MDWVKEKMYQARLQRSRLQEDGHISSPDNHAEGILAVPARRYSRLLSINKKLSWLAGGAVLGAVIVTMVWRVGLIREGDELTASTLEQYRKLMELPTPSETNKMKEELANLNEQVHLLTATVADLQAKLLENYTEYNSIAGQDRELEPDDSQQQANSANNMQQLEVLPPPAAVLDYTRTPKGKETLTPGAAAGNTHISSIGQSTTANVEQTQDADKESGPWEINVASLLHKADAERFVGKAKSRGVDAGLYQVTVKGKKYWRVHVTGFHTAAEAKSNADVIKERLGLKEVWVAKR